MPSKQSDEPGKRSGEPGKQSDELGKRSGELPRKQSDEPGKQSGELGKQSGELSQKQLLSIAHDQDVDVPVLSYRIVGDRVELNLYGGRVISALTGFPQSASSLEDLPISRLRKMAADLDIPGRSKMDKDELIEAILSAHS